MRKQRLGAFMSELVCHRFYKLNRSVNIHRFENPIRSSARHMSFIIRGGPHTKTADRRLQSDSSRSRPV